MFILQASPTLSFSKFFFTVNFQLHQLPATVFDLITKDWTNLHIFVKAVVIYIKKLAQMYRSINDDMCYYFASIK